MPHETALIATIAAGMGLAFVLGLAATRLRLPPLVGYKVRAILKLARRLNPNVEVVVRTHSDQERTFLESHGAERALVGERELAVSLARHALRHFEVAHDMEAVAERALGRRPATAPAGDESV